MTDPKRVALIVGASSPAGEAVARGLAAAGLRLALNDLMPGRIESLAKELNAGGAQAIAHAADVSRKLALQTMLQAVLEPWERIDLLVFLPVAQPAGNLLDLDEWDWHRTLDLNLSAAFLCMQSVGRVMRELGGGRMVLAQSLQPGAPPAWQAASGGLGALAAAAGVELGTHRIAVHSCPAEPDQILALCLAETKQP
ncbi:MAG: SDR family NAD(P)-dependent oxidoreductase [Anaerolineales bacterium]|nr:SDR family NAD(P)-dependent oxidoreductase [Anaerolineales bacterium]MCW5855467.1 SDR family NAD(P)-dependent oxidoreductase [Anaerolineales bacterium]